LLLVRNERLGIYPVAPVDPIVPIAKPKMRANKVPNKNEQRRYQKKRGIGIHETLLPELKMFGIYATAGTFP